ncbi:synaptic vesicle glycoprotein 2B-like [Sitophilus oryzae]|uniref:Synaptic vesicle glycoprotein 2B-like n=1 Tax=Sitophilus oryzae TaxID=7048 RepID=A0A6J2X641_SITOR|nr:synaptic vesicle glycoprotein 2B-like [Sitophilus oryzae]
METEVDFIDSRKASVISDVKSLSRRVSELDPATFEEAIAETKFGKFNLLLFVLAIPASLCTVFDTSTMSYTFVAAQCDLELSLDDKGLLNAVTYAGMISSAIIWGFLFDVLGRKKLLVIGFLVDSIFVFTSALTQNIALLLVTKYLQGFIINGPFAALSSYMSEFHSAKYRPMCQIIIGSCNSFGTAFLPLIAWLILPYKIDFFVGDYSFHSWNIFLLVSGLPAFTSGLFYMFLPESPKFLMTCGQNEKALEVLRRVYSINTGEPRSSYPIKMLIDETKLNGNNKHGGKVTAQRSTTQALKEGLQQIKPLFYPPHLAKVCLTCSIMFFSVMR